MDQGKIVGEGTPGEIFANTALLRGAELRLPRVSHLVEILKKKDGLDFPEMPLTIGQARRELLRLVEYRCTSRENNRRAGVSGGSLYDRQTER